MMERFEGKEGRAALLNALRSQFLVEGNSDIAAVLALSIRLREFAPGTVFINEGERGGDLFLILAGQVSIRKCSEEIATYGAGMHVGEIGLLEPFKGRMASVVAIDRVVAAQVPEQRFADIARQHPVLWRRMALELAHRLVKAQDAVCV